MKKMYFFVLTLITTAFVLGLALLKVNEACSNELFSIPANLQPYVDYAVDYGAMTLLCLFAFGGLAGKIVKLIVIILIVLAIVVFIIATAVPQWLQGLFGGGEAGGEAVVKLFTSMLM